jgi:hypothetical protein
MALILDTYTNAELACALRWLRSAYTGKCLRVRRSSDSAEQDIGFNPATGQLDWAAATTFANGANLFVRTWYDQSGKGNNFVQATATKQPQLDLTNHWIAADGTDDFLETTANVDLSGTDDVDVFFRFKHPSFSESTRIFWEHTSAGSPINLFTFFYTSSKWRVHNNLSSSISEWALDETFSTLKVVTFSIDRSLSSGEPSARVNSTASNGSLASNANTSGNFKSDKLYLFCRGGINFFTPGHITDFILFPQKRPTTDQSVIEADITNQYSEGTPDTTPPTDCEIAAPQVLGQNSISVALTQPSTDNESGMKRYYYEIDTVNTFDSGNKITGYTSGTSGPFTIGGLAANYNGFIRFKGEDNAQPSNLSVNWSSVRSFKTWNVAPSFVTAANLGNANINQQTDFPLQTQNGEGTRIIEVQPGENMPDGIILVGTNNHTVRVNRSTPGTVSIPLLVKDDKDQTGTRTFTVTLVDPNAVPPVAAFTVPSIIGKNQNFSPVNQSTGASSYAWDKENDGNTDSTEANPTFSYSTTGIKTIKLTATNAYGSDEETKQIEVVDLAIWDFEIDYPMEFEYGKKVRVFIPRSGPKHRQTRVDTGMKWKLEVRSEYFSPEEREAIIEFYEEHFPSKNFLFHDQDSNEYFEAWISSTVKAPKKRRGGGDFAFVIEQV